jgi:hypothetical protein
VEEERAARGGEKEGAPSPYIAARGFTGALLPARAKTSPFPRELLPATSPAATFRQCAARSRAPRKRTLAAFPGSHPGGSLLAVFSQAAKRTSLAKKASCSPRAQPGYWATLPNTPLAAPHASISRCSDRPRSVASPRRQRYYRAHSSNSVGTCEKIPEQEYVRRAVQYVIYVCVYTRRGRKSERIPIKMPSCTFFRALQSSRYPPQIIGARILLSPRRRHRWIHPSIRSRLSPAINHRPRALPGNGADVRPVVSGFVC